MPAGTLAAVHTYRQVLLADLTPYPNNARTHSESQVNQIAASMREWGWTNPVLVDEHNGIIAGHARVQAARKLGMTIAPAIEVAGLTPAQKRALVLADNKLALNAGWDDEMLRLELDALKLDGFDLPLIGFSDEELATLLADMTEGLTDPDDVPEVQPEAVTRLGDVWLLGKHRLCCGDATSEVDVSHALGGVRPHLMVTDPPYGVDYDAKWRSSLDQWNQATGAVCNDDRVDWCDAWALFPGDVAYVWHAGRHASAIQASLDAAAFEIRCQIVWTKPAFAIGRGNYHWQHEPCWYAVRKDKTAHWVGDRKQSTVWEIRNNTFQGGKSSPEDTRTGHGTQKPVECMRRPIENNSSPGQAVYDPFLGSGTTLIAAEMTGRSAHCLEIAPQYVDVAIRRWQSFTGQSATLYGTEQTFAEVEAERTV